MSNTSVCAILRKVNFRYEERESGCRSHSLGAEAWNALDHNYYCFACAVALLKDMFLAIAGNKEVWGPCRNTWCVGAGEPSSYGTPTQGIPIG